MRCHALRPLLLLPACSPLARRSLSAFAFERLPAPPPADGAERQKKRHALLTFGFCGTEYYGLQSQNAEGDPLHPTVSDVVRRALLQTGFIAESNFAPLRRTSWQLASRTDKGVHACCAAASVRLETLAADLAPSTAVSEVDEGGDGDVKSETSRDWQLSRTALNRINAALPPDVRVFSAAGVRKRFDARECASSRTYEYLLPASSLGEGSVEELDAALRCFEGTHRMHNFGSGLRRYHESHGETHCFEGEDEEGKLVSWPLALPLDEQSPAAYRSVITCRVLRTLTVSGAPYVLLRISGLAFVLHQIRHMVGAALAAANGVTTRDAIVTALRTPLRVDTAPLVPGAGLLLDEVRWFDVRTGGVESSVPAEARAAMLDFKRDVIYPHIHSVYSADGGSRYARFVAEMRGGYFGEGARSGARVAFDAARLARVADAFDRRRRLLVEEKRRAREERKAERAEGARERSPRLPGGLLVALCVARQQLPGPETHEAMAMLRSRLEAGDLVEGKEYAYYIEDVERQLQWQ